MNKIKNVDIKQKLKSERVRLDIKTKDIAEALNVNSSFVSYIEKTFEDNSRYKYLKYLRDKGVDINSILD